MSEGVNFDFSGLPEWQRFLKSLGDGEINKLKDRILRTAGMRTLEYIIEGTPVRTGRLKQSHTAGDRDNIFEIAVARSNSHVRVGTAVPYAKHVNDGFTQRRGQFVPGEWRSGHFHYRPELYPKGMVLTGKTIPGTHAYEKARARMEEDMPVIMEFEIRRLFAELGRRRR